MPTRPRALTHLAPVPTRADASAGAEGASEAESDRSYDDWLTRAAEPAGGSPPDDSESEVGDALGDIGDFRPESRAGSKGGGEPGVAETDDELQAELPMLMDDT